MSSDGPRVAVTGAAGFIGSATVRALLADGQQSVPIVRRIDDRSPAGARSADVTARAGMAAALGGCDVLIHAAALVHRRGASDEALTRTNVDGTRVVLEAAAEAGVRRVVLVSSVAVYGSGDDVDERSRCEPRTAYGRSKLASERTAADVAGARGLELVIVRPSTVIGPGDPGSMATLGRSLARRRFVWVGTGENRKTPIAVDDVAHACLTLALDRDAAGGVFNLAGQAVTVRQIVDAYARALGATVPSWHLPARAVRAGLRLASAAAIVVPPLASGRAALDAWLSTDVYDASAYAKRYGHPARTAWEDSLRDEADWILTHG